MKTALKSAIAAIAVCATALSPVTASAQGRGNDGNGDAPGWDQPDNSRIYRRDGRHYYPRHVYRKHRKHVRRHRDGDAAAAAILGIAGAAIIAGAIASQPRREIYVSPRGYAPYPPAPRGPNVITYESTLEPWTAGWYEWCDARYRSFNPRTGTYRGYDGRDHFCVPK